MDQQPFHLRPIPRNSGSGKYHTRHIRDGKLSREYILYEPAARPQEGAALVLVYHGGAAHARSAIKLTGFSCLADEQSFWVVYPEGYKAHWGDGRGTTPPDKEGIDDSAFTARLLDQLIPSLGVDPSRIFATGMSNGGMFAHRLGLELSGRIAAIAPVAGTMARNLSLPASLAAPVSVLQIHGTEDRLEPYTGGAINTVLGGTLRSFHETAAEWARLNRCRTDPKQLWPLPGAPGGMVVEVEVYQVETGAGVTSVTVHGGGHTWPGGPQYLPEPEVGQVCRSFDATALIWDFFIKHPRRNQVTRYRSTPDQ